MREILYRYFCLLVRLSANKNLETAIEEIKSIWEKIESSESKKNHNIGDDFTDYAIIVNSKIYDKIHEDAGILMLLKALRYV